MMPHVIIWQANLGCALETTNRSSYQLTDGAVNETIVQHPPI